MAAIESRSGIGKPGVIRADHGNSPNDLVEVRSYAEAMWTLSWREKVLQAIWQRAPEPWNKENDGRKWTSWNRNC
jgi:hypothetical protein